jgi:hypothetical protein
VQLDPSCTHPAVVRSLDAAHATFIGSGAIARTELPIGGRLGMTLPPDSATWITTSCPGA